VIEKPANAIGSMMTATEIGSLQNARVEIAPFVSPIRTKTTLALFQFTSQ
jgi:hypothetical protein